MIFGLSVKRRKTGKLSLIHIFLIASFLLLIPSVFGYFHTRVNYDVLTYLPDDIETMQGQDIMLEDFGIGAFSMFMVDGMEDKDVAALKSKIEQVDHVKMCIRDRSKEILKNLKYFPEELRLMYPVSYTHLEWENGSYGSNIS